MSNTSLSGATTSFVPSFKSSVVSVPSRAKIHSRSESKSTFFILWFTGLGVESAVESGAETGAELGATGFNVFRGRALGRDTRALNRIRKRIKWRMSSK